MFQKLQDVGREQNMKAGAGQTNKIKNRYKNILPCKKKFEELIK